MFTILRTLSLALGIAATATAAQADIRRMTIGTNPQGTMYYVVGGGLAKLWSDKLGIRATVQPYAGASVYLPLIESGEVTMGLSSSLDSSMAFNGKGAYEVSGGLRKLRTLSRAWPLPYAFVTRADSGIRTVSDLKGKRVAVNFRANAALEDANRAMLTAAGLNPDTDVEAVTISGIPEGYSLMADGTIAAVPTVIGIPILRQADATIPGGVMVLGLDGDGATTEFLNSQLRGLYAVETKPRDNNPGVDVPKVVAGFDSYYVVNADMSEDDAYRLLKTMWEAYEQLQADFPVLRTSPRENLASASNTVPFHPGAVRFFREMGLWKEENEVHDARLMAGG